MKARPEVPLGTEDGEGEHVAWRPSAVRVARRGPAAGMRRERRYSTAYPRCTLAEGGSRCGRPRAGEAARGGDSPPARRPFSRDLRKALRREAASPASNRAYGSPGPRSAERRAPRANRADSGLAQPCGNGRRERGTRSGGAARTGKPCIFQGPAGDVHCGLPRP